MTDCRSVISRMEMMVAEMEAAGRRPLRWRISLDVRDELRGHASMVEWVRLAGDIDRILGISIVCDTSLPPNSIVLEPLDEAPQRSRGG